MGTIALKPDVFYASERSDATNVVSLSSADLDDNEDSDISGVLSASRDVFASAAAFAFGSARFRIRGYDSELTSMYINGAPVNDLENGRINFNAWGGLNDVMRNVETHIGLKPMDFAFGEVGGGTFIDIRPSKQRKQLRASYSISNRSYRNRLMLTYATGPRPNGWAFAFSGSKRWAQSGYSEGTPYDAYAYFASAEKKFNRAHALGLTIFGSPRIRGKNAAATQEMYDLAGTNFYNSYWGYQNGEKRNSRIQNVHQPMAILRHDWNPNEKFSLTTSLSYQFGRNGSTALDWYKTRDPRPDYYRKLPSYIEDETASAKVEQLLIENENLRQLDWDYFYSINRNSPFSIGSVSGNRSKYIVEDRRYDSKEMNANVYLGYELSRVITLRGGLSYQNYQGDNFKEVVDLLGGDFYVDIDKFAERDFLDDHDVIQSDLNNPDRTVTKGDRFGYSYGSNINNTSGWLSGEFTLKRFDFHLGVRISSTTFWRTGDYRNGKFPDNSYGDSEKADFLNYGTKGGFTFKVDGRNYLFVNATYQTKAPYFRNAFLSPRTRNQLLPNLTDEKVTAGEAGYLLRSPSVQAQAVAYYTLFRDQVYLRSFYHDEEKSFVNYFMQGVGKRHMGAEISMRVKVSPTLSVSGVAAFGTYQYDKRPVATISQDNNANLLAENRTVYAKNFFVAGRPQTAFTAGFYYRSPKFWSLSVNANYFNHTYMDFNPDRRTEFATDVVEYNSETWNAIIDQERAPDAFTLDMFASKSFRFNRKYSLYITAGVNNILNKTDFITGGYEQLRFDYEEKNVDKFPTKYYYGYGLNYFINISLSI